MDVATRALPDAFDCAEDHTYAAIAAIVEVRMLNVSVPMHAWSLPT